MKAICLKEPKNLAIVERPMPAAAADEVKVRVRVAGICASDRRAYYGTHPLVKYPFIMGRNFAGEVVALGASVDGIALGDRVAIDPVFSCRQCASCLAGYSNLCEALQVMGIHKDGGMAEFIAVPACNAHVVPKDWSWERIAMVDPFTVAANILSRAPCAEGDSVLILGAGVAGLSVLMAAKRLGVRVAVSDVLETRLAMATDLGANFVLNMHDDDFQQKIMRWTEDRGISLTVDVVCLSDFFPLLQKIAAPRGRIVYLSFSEQPLPLIPWEINKKELSILGSRLHCGLFPKVIEWFSGEKTDLSLRGTDSVQCCSALTASHEDFEPERLVSHVFPYTEVGEAFMLMEESPVNVTKVLLMF